MAGRERPRHIMRNASLFLNRVSYIGQASEIGFGELKMITEEIFNGGQMVKIEVPMGYDMPENSFKMTGFDPAVMRLFGLRIGTETELMATGANGDDTGEIHSMTAYMRGFIKELKPDSHKRGDKTEIDYTFSFRYYRLEIDGNPIIEMDPFEVKVGGVSQTGQIRRALLG